MNNNSQDYSEQESSTLKIFKGGNYISSHKFYLFPLWDSILRLYSDSFIDRAAMSLLGIAGGAIYSSNILRNNNSSGSLYNLEMINADYAVLAIGCLSIFYLLWFAGRLLTRLGRAQ